MTTKPIESFFPTADNVEPTASIVAPTASIVAPVVDDESAAKKRARSMDSSGSSTSSSPASKRTIYDGEEEVFEMPEEAPSWTCRLFKAIDSMTQKMNDLSCKFDDITTKFDNYKIDIDAQITAFKSEVTAKVVDLEKSVKFVSDSFDSQKQTNEHVEKQIQDLKGELRRAIDAQVDATDSLEQYSRRNCALLHGVPENDGEDTDAIFRNTISQHLGVVVKPRDLDRSHRIGAKRSDGSGRPIIAKFARYNTRAVVFREKRKFKDTGMMLTESLTKRRVAILNAARDKHGKTNVWTSDGEILTSKDKKIVNVRDL